MNATSTFGHSHGFMVSQTYNFPVTDSGINYQVEDVNIDGKNINTVNNSEVKHMGGDLLIPRLGDKAFMLSPSTFNRLLYMR